MIVLFIILTYAQSHYCGHYHHFSNGLNKLIILNATKFLYGMIIECYFTKIERKKKTFINNIPGDGG